MTNRSWDIPDELIEHDEELVKRNSGGGFQKLKQGDNVLRILPSKDPTKSPFKVVHEHFVPDAQGRKRKFACPRLHAHQPCPACSYYNLLTSSTNHADLEAARDFKASTRVYVNAIDRDNEEAGPQTFNLPAGVYDQMREILKDKRVGGNFTNPTKEGFDLVIKRTGSGPTDTRYKTIPDRNNTELGNMDWIEQQSDLSRLALLPDYDTFVAAMPDAAKERLQLGAGGTRRLSSTKEIAAGGRAPFKARGKSVQNDILNASYTVSDDDEDELI